MTSEDLERQYTQIPQEVKNLKRWVCIQLNNEDGMSRYQSIEN